ncbi:hypothetical protein OENI_20076 [Oenococcus oeni]|nr:hypothetical protein OENI_20076 [Oenococcus oeni]
MKALKMRKEGIEPSSQEPESYVMIHYTTRANITIILDYLLVCNSYLFGWN